MCKYCISYITNSRFTVLNHVVDARSMSDAISDIKGDTGVQMIISCVGIDVD